MKRKLLLWLLVVFLVPFLIPEARIIPVKGASENDWNKNTFWYEPWGSSGVHKGVDIFAKEGAAVISSTSMLIVYKGSFRKGGNVVLGIGPRWRLHYFAHMQSINEQAGFFVSAGYELGTVGDTGNAKGKQPHLHYSILTLLPYLWLIDDSTQGYNRAIYLNPIEYFGDPSL